MFNLVEVSGETFERSITLECELEDFCRAAFAEGKPASVNMDVEDWHTKSHTLFYMIYSGRFSNGMGQLYLLYDRDTLVALSGAYRSSFDPCVKICGVRAYTAAAYRTRYLHGEYIFPAQFERARREGYKVALLTFNDYNRALFDFLKRVASKQATAFGLKSADTYKDLEFLDYKVRVNHTEQYAAVKRLDPDYQYDFSNIRVA